MSRPLAELLVKERILTPQQLVEADQALRGQARGYIKYFLEKRLISEMKLLSFLSQKFGLATINLSKFEVRPEVIRLVSLELVKKHRVVPIQANSGTLVVATSDPVSISFVDEIKFAAKMNVEVVLTSYSAIEQAIAKYYGGAAVALQAIAQFRKDASRTDATKPVSSGIEIVEVHEIDSASNESDAPVIALVNGILSEAIRRMASDIHVEPYEKRMRVRMRIDGTLIELAEIPLEMKRAVTARFKIMSRMDIGEARVPQDGRIKLKAGGAEIDFRVNTLPTLFGEKVVLRILSKGNLQLDLLKLGFEAQQLEVFKKGIYSPNGMVLVTGPTGSGKTTTLYSALSELNQMGDNLSTAEDPVEYNLEGINQVQVNKDVGLTFASVLRSLLRQDPDTVLVGEIRDYETAEIAIQAALTGHLVLSTLHTNDATSTITRLVNMGIEPFLVVASVNTILAQRLLRTVCPKCKEVSAVPKDKLNSLGYTPEVVAQVTFYKGKGCAHCNNTGYKGRVAIYEVLDFSPTLKEMVLRGDSIQEVKKQAVKEGMKTLRMSALTKAAEGRTTLEEALSMTMES